ncbi:hypothetical protein HS7_01090 [Sulfolobales archaeon HS-7]|nr:hypothetical protein HS7_01090 [Sulfolobales archaeon HS-7]
MFNPFRLLPRGKSSTSVSDHVITEVVYKGLVVSKSKLPKPKNVKDCHVDVGGSGLFIPITVLGTKRVGPLVYDLQELFRCRLLSNGISGN